MIMRAAFCFILTLLLSISVHSQTKSRQYLDASRFEQCLKEAYGSSATRFTKDPKKLEVMRKLYTERILILTETYKSYEKYPKLSSIPLLDIPETDLERDTSFDIKTFNPFKYQLGFFASSSKIYRVDNTNYLIYIVSQYKS